MAEQDKKRNPYADMGLMIAVTIVIVMIIKTLLFANTFDSWECIVLIILAVAYLVVSKKYDSESPVVKHSTTALLCLSILMLTSLFLFDHKSSPKMHAFEGARTDTIPEEEFIQKKEPTIEIIDSDTITPVIIDSLAVEEGEMEENAEEPNEEETEVEETEPTYE